jgi:hypothetical protein
MEKCIGVSFRIEVFLSISINIKESPMKSHERKEESDKSSSCIAIQHNLG